MVKPEEVLFKTSKDMRDLQFLEELEKNLTISQRELSKKFNIAQGVTNGLNHRQIYYHLTSEGLDMKARLFLKYLAYNVRLYTHIKNLFTRKLQDMENKGIKKVVFMGSAIRWRSSMLPYSG